MFRYVDFVIRGFRRRYSDNHRMIRRTYVHMHIYMQVETIKETPILSDAAVIKGKTGWDIYRGAWIANEKALVV